MSQGNLRTARWAIAKRMEPISVAGLSRRVREEKACLPLQGGGPVAAAGPRSGRPTQRGRGGGMPSSEGTQNNTAPTPRRQTWNSPGVIKRPFLKIVNAG